jgi:fructokinase
LYRLSKDCVTADTLADVKAETMEDYLRFSNRFCGISVTKNGAIASYPSLEEMK